MTDKDRMEPDRIALVDLDGTVADYGGALAKEMRAIQHPDEEPYADRYEELTKRVELPHVEARRKMIQRVPGFWRSLERLDLGFDVVTSLRVVGFQLHVLTKGPRSNAGAWAEKLEWAREHIPDATVTVTGDKSIMYGRVLVDDYPPYFNAWLENRPRGLVVCRGSRSTSSSPRSRFSAKKTTSRKKRSTCERLASGSSSSTPHCRKTPCEMTAASAPLLNGAESESDPTSS